jgi:hypothetical protein
LRLSCRSRAAARAVFLGSRLCYDLSTGAIFPEAAARLQWIKRRCAASIAVAEPTLIAWVKGDIVSEFRSRRGERLAREHEYIS